MRRKTVTLVELIIVTVLVGALSLGFSWYLMNAIDMWQFVSFRSEIASQAELALAQMSRNIRQATAGSIEDAKHKKITFGMLDDNDSPIRVQYKYNSTNGRLLYKLDNNNDGTWDSSDILLSGVSNLRFDYFDSAGNSTATPSDVYLINTDISVAKGSQSATLSSRVFPRNFKL